MCEQAGLLKAIHHVPVNKKKKKKKSIRKSGDSLNNYIVVRGRAQAHRRSRKSWASCFLDKE